MRHVTSIPGARAVLGAMVLGALALAAAAAGAPKLVTPKPGAIVKTTHPVFRWSLPLNEKAIVVSVASGPETTDTGEFVREHQVEIGFLDGTLTEWTPTRPIPAGTYYWHVASRPVDKPDNLFSPAVKFTIPVLVSIDAITSKPYPTAHSFLVDVSWKANVRSTTVTGRLMKGSKVVFKQTSTRDNFLLDQATHYITAWIVPPTIKRGTPLRLVVTVTAKGARGKPAWATATRSLRAP